MLNFCDERDFRRRCTAWVILTVVEFASPSFWLFALLMFIVLRWCARKDGNPLATYALLLNAVPPLQADVPFVGINVLFSLDTYRLLALGILIPFVWQQRKASHQASFGYMDFMLLIFGALQIALFVRPDTPDAWQLHDSFTNILRRACLFLIDAYMLYAAFKHLGGRAKIREFMAFYCLGCAILAALAIFESLRHWLLYADVGATWGVEAVTKYLDRAGILRASVSTGHALVLGYLLAIALAFWVYLSDRAPSKRHRYGGIALFVLGLLAAYSRGPWLGAVTVCLVYYIAQPRKVAAFAKVAVWSSALGVVLLLSPLGERITSVIPFFGGTVDAYNIDYRRALADKSVEVVKAHPWFGDQEAYSKLQKLRQGVGVIDFVNSYAQVAVFYGLIGLSAFAMFLLLGIWKAYQTVRRGSLIDPDLRLIGSSVLASLVGTAVMIYTSSFIFAYEKMFYVLCGLAVACQRIDVYSKGEPPNRVTGPTADAAPGMGSRPR